MTDEFDAAVTSSLLPDPGFAAKTGYAAALDTNPDAYAEAKRVATSTGVPVDTALAMPNEIKRQAAVGEIDFDTLAKTAPATAAVLADFDKARVAHDNVDSMSTIEGLLKPVARMVRQTVAGATADFGAATYGALETGAKTAAPLIDPLVGTLLPENPFDRVGAGLEELRKSSEATADMIAGGKSTGGLLEQGIESGFRSFGQMGPGLVLSVLTGDPQFALGAGGFMQGSQSATKALDQGAAPATALTYGLEDAAAEVATEMLPVGALLKDLKAGAPLYKVLAHQIATEVPSELAATAWQNLNEWLNLHPEKSASEYLEQLGPDEAQTVIATITTSVLTAGLGKGAHAVVNLLQTRDAAARQAEQGAALMQQLGLLAAADKVLARDPATFHQFIADASENGPLTHVYIDAGQLAQSGLAEQLAAASPSVAAQLPAAAQSGGQVQIPVEDYLTNIAPHDGAEALLDHLKTEPGGFSRAEAAEYVKTQGDELRAEVERVLTDHEADASFKDSAAAVRTEVKRQLDETARFTPEVNDAYASMIGNFYAVTAAKANMTPEELFQHYPLQVAAERVIGQDLDQTDSAAFKNWFGESKAVDEHGTPLTLYHGTSKDTDFTGFRANKNGIWFTTNPDEASSYAADNDSQNFEFRNGKYDRTNTASRVIPVRLSLQNPKVYDEVPEELRTAENYKRAQAALFDTLKAEGHDGVIFPGGTYVVFNASQAKSAIGNRGTYDPNSPNILRQDELEADAESDDTPAIEQGDIPESVDQAAGYANAFKTAASKIWAKGRDLKAAIQEAVRQAAEAAGVDVSAPSPATTEYLVRTGVKDALYALQQNPNAIGWYDLKTRQALAVMALVHPEIAKDQNARFAFTWALAVTSNGIKVGKNFELAEAAYVRYKATGEMPTDVQAGTAQAQINKGLGLFNQLKQEWGIDELRKFMLTNFTVSHIAAIDMSLKPGGEHGATTVRGAAVLGPKIGNGFFSNLYGNFDALTMDRWLIRTWGRWTGTLIKQQPHLEEHTRKRVRGNLADVIGDSAAAKAIGDVVGMPLEPDMDVDQLAVAIADASQKPANREVMNATEAGANLRKSGNMLWKYLDGQKEAPSGPTERNYIRSVFERVLGELRGQEQYKDLTMADLQAVLWYAEKRLYESAKEDLGEDDEAEGYTDQDAPDYANAAAAVARANGVTDRKIQNALRREQDGRTADARPGDGGPEGTAGAGQQGAAAGFTPGEKRVFVGRLAVHRARRNRYAGGGESWSYGRRGRPDGGRPGLLKKLGATWVAEWKPGKALGNLFRANAVTTPTFYELDPGDAVNAQRFADAVTENKTASKVGAAVYVYPAEDYAGMRLLLAEDGKSGVAVKPNGDIVSVFSTGGAGRSVIEAAVAAGGTKLDAFDTILPPFYAAHGFRATSRLRWDDSQAPPEWDKKTFAKFNNGEPDVVFMALDKAYNGTYSKKDGEVFTGDDAYDRAVARQDNIVARLRRRNGEFAQDDQTPPPGWGTADNFDPSSPDPLKPNAGSRGTYNPATHTIALLQNADLSTFLHEAGHFFLEVTAGLADRADATPQMRQDMAALLKWFGVKDLATWRAMSIDEQRPFHEQFARGFEAYLFEGKAPNTELNGLFQRVRAWMLAVYRDIKALHVELTDEVRGVFDRMLATTDAIQAAESARRMLPLFENAAAAGMTMEEFKAYHALGVDATNQAIQELQAKSLKDMTWTSKLLERTTRRLNKEARSKRREVRAEVAAELIKQPVFAAGEWLRTGKVTNEAGETTTTEGMHKLAVDPIAAEFPATANNPVPWHSLGYDRGGMLSKDGLDPDLVAEQFGFSSGSELVRRLVAAGPYQDAVEQATDRRMLERFGDLNSPEAIARATEEAVHNAVRARFVETEANALAKLAGKRKVLASAARDYAGQMIARLRIRDVRPAQFSASEAKAAAAAARAVKEGRFDEAAEAKRAQLIQAQAARAALQAQGDIEKGLRYLKRFRGNVANLDSGYLDQIHALLERFDLRQVSERDAVRRMAFTKWLDEQRQAGFEPDIPPDLETEALRLPYKEMTVEEFRGLVDTVKQIEHLGRLKSRLLTARKTRAYEAARAEIVESIDKHSQGREANTRTPTTRAGRVAQNLRRFWAAHIKAATWARVMDGGHDAGAMWEYFIRGANERGDRETRMRAEATRKLTDILTPVLAMGKMGGKGQFFPSINRSLNREARITIALNWGNEGNRQRLLGGEGWTEQQVIPVLQTLSGADWRAVQAIWDDFEGYRPAIAAKERRVYGKEPNWVDPSPFTLHTDAGYHVELRGGYYPIKFDPNASQRAEEHADAEGAKRQLQGAYTSATTRRSFTKNRVSEVKGRPLLYTLAGVYSGVNDVIHDLCWHEWLIDTNRLLRSSAIDEAIREHYGPEVKAQFKDWSRDIAEGDRGAANAGDIAATWLRRSISVSGLGFNIMSALMQPLGITQSMVRVGTPWVARGITKYIAHPIELTRKVNSMSSFMEERARTRLRELNELRNQVQDHAIAKERIGRYAYFLMMRCQQMVDIPTWWGGYEKAIAAGADEDSARALADQGVIDSQGSGMTKDLSAIERGGPVQRLFTVFYSFMNTALNIGVERTMSADTPAKRAQLAVDYLMLFVVPPVLGYALKRAVTPDDDDDDLGKLLLHLAGADLDYLMGLMVGVREFGEAAKTAVGGGELGHDYQGPSGVRGIVDMTKLVQQAHQGEFDDAFRKAMVNVLGDFTGLPAAQINRTITGVQALNEGKTDNPAAIVFGFQAKH